MKMGKRVLQRSDGRTALKAKVENVVLKKLSGKKKPKHCLERGVFKSKTEIFMCAKVMSKKKRFLFFFWPFSSLPQDTQKQKMKCKSHQKSHPDWSDVKWKKSPTARRPFPWVSPYRRLRQGRCKCLQCFPQWRATWEIPACLACTVRQSGKKKKATPCHWYYSRPLGDRKEYAAGSSRQSINCLAYKAPVLCV